MCRQSSFLNLQSLHDTVCKEMVNDLGFKKNVGVQTNTLMVSESMFTCSYNSGKFFGSKFTPWSNKTLT